MPIANPEILFGLTYVPTRGPILQELLVDGPDTHVDHLISLARSRANPPDGVSGPVTPLQRIVLRDWPDDATQSKILELEKYVVVERAPGTNEH